MKTTTEANTPRNRYALTRRETAELRRLIDRFRQSQARASVQRAACLAAGIAIAQNRLRGVQ